MTAAYGCPSVRQPDDCSPNPVPVTNRDAKTREIKIQTLKDVLFFVLWGKMDGQKAESGQCKSIPVDPVVMGSW